jgi:CheY-like chemotaxis protein
MSSTITSSRAISQSESSMGVNGAIERRRRKRAKIAARVHVASVNVVDSFEEICRSVDVSRDGLLFIAARSGYWKGQQLAITFPYSDAAAALSQAQAAEIVRVAPIEGGQFHVAVQFLAARVEAKSEKKGYASPAESFAGKETVVSSSGNGKQQTVVLAVEPDPRQSEMLKGLLSQDGYTVVVVPTAEEALEVLRTTIPAVFLAEVEGGEMSGHDLCLIIKRNDRLARVPVILLTKSAQPADYASSHQLGAVVCMAKPFKPERLRNCIRLVAPPPKYSASAYGSARLSSNIERSL